MAQLCSVIDNRDVDGSARITTTNPATGEVLAEVSALDEEGARDAVAAARRAWPAWAATSFAQRQRLLARWLALLVEEEKPLAELVAREGGKPVNEARLVDLFPACETLSFLARRLHRLLAFKPVRRGRCSSPTGVPAIATIHSVLWR